MFSHPHLVAFCLGFVVAVLCVAIVAAALLGRHKLPSLIYQDVTVSKSRKLMVRESGGRVIFTAEVHPTGGCALVIGEGRDVQTSGQLAVISPVPSEARKWAAGLFGKGRKS